MDIIHFLKLVSLFLTLSLSLCVYSECVCVCIVPGFIPNTSVWFYVSQVWLDLLKPIIKQIKRKSVPQCSFYEFGGLYTSFLPEGLCLISVCILYFFLLRPQAHSPAFCCEVFSP